MGDATGGLARGLPPLPPRRHRPRRRRRRRRKGAKGKRRQRRIIYILGDIKKDRLLGTSGEREKSSFCPTNPLFMHKKKITKTLRNILKYVTKCTYLCRK